MLICVRPRLFASVLEELLRDDERAVTVVDPDEVPLDESDHEVAVLSDRRASETHASAEIWLPDPERGRTSALVRIDGRDEIVAITTTAELVDLVDQAGALVRAGNRP